MVANRAQAIVPTSTDLDIKAEVEQVNVLYSFLENRYTRKVSTISEPNPGPGR